MDSLDKRGIEFPPNVKDRFGDMPHSMAAYVCLQMRPKRTERGQVEEFERIMNRFEEVDGLHTHVEGWFACVRAIDTGSLGALPKCQHTRLEVFKQLRETEGWDTDIQTMVCGLSSQTFDLFVQTNDPYEGSDGRTQGRVFGYLKSLMRSDEQERDKQKGYIKWWWEDEEAEPFTKGGSKCTRDY